MLWLSWDSPYHPARDTELPITLIVSLAPLSGIVIGFYITLHSTLSSILPGVRTDIYTPLALHPNSRIPGYIKYLKPNQIVLSYTCLQQSTQVIQLSWWGNYTALTSLVPVLQLAPLTLLPLSTHAPLTHYIPSPYLLCGLRFLTGLGSCASSSSLSLRETNSLGCTSIISLPYVRLDLIRCSLYPYSIKHIF